MTEPTISCPVRRWAETEPDGLALLTPVQTWTWATLDRDVARAAAVLRAHAPSATRVAVQMPNGPDLVLLILAAWRTGHVLAPLSTRIPAGLTQTHLKRLGCEALFTLRAIETGAQPDDLTPIPLHQPATIIFTSGSTGQPKAALHTVGNHMASADGVNEALGLRVGDRWLLNLPLYHVGGLAIVVRCVLAGATMVLPAAKASVGEAMAAFGVTHASLVAAQLHRLLEANRTLPAALRAVLLGGSAIPPGVLDEAHARGWPVHTSYGLTEMASTVTMTRFAASRDALATSGPVLPHRELMIRDGEIHVRGATRFAGYVEGETVVQPFDEAGWFATGDLGTLYADGTLRVTGRRDNRFISGGENIQPEAIEAALARLPGITRAVVVPVPDAVFGQRPVAFLDVAGSMPTLEAVREGLVEALPRFMWPIAVHPWPGAAEDMKPDRKALQAEAARLKST